MNTFSDKVALITGASRGIGRELAILLATQGASVVVAYRKNEALANEVVREAQRVGRGGIAIQADVERPEDIDRMFDVVAEKYGKLDCFVANAAATAFKKVGDFRQHHLDRSFATNVRSFVIGAQRAVTLMTGGGKIVAISSYGSTRVFPGYAALGSAKAAIEAWVRYMAVEFAPRGINVNSVVGGIIDTDSSKFFYGLPGTPPLADVVKTIPKARLGGAAEIAHAVAFLLGPYADYITGQSLVVDGGLSVITPPFAGDMAAPLV